MFMLEKKYRIFSKHVIFFVSILFMFGVGGVDDSHAEELTISIPFGAYNPKLDTPTEVWYDPPIINIKVGDTITWLNDDKEGHTVTSGDSAGRFGWMSEKQGGFGKPDGIFDSGRFMPDDSWTHTFQKLVLFHIFVHFILGWKE